MTPPRGEEAGCGVSVAVGVVWRREGGGVSVGRNAGEERALRPFLLRGLREQGTASGRSPDFVCCY